MEKSVCQACSASRRIERLTVLNLNIRAEKRKEHAMGRTSMSIMKREERREQSGANYAKNAETQIKGKELTGAGKAYDRAYGRGRQVLGQGYGQANGRLSEEVLYEYKTLIMRSAFHHTLHPNSELNKKKAN